ncbi:hypothetical protein Clacol_001400 [Clathrus columnatus]|uniref:Pre-rRNA-processing protein RIX1 n=1 Tax=Clathrus columnatus TaxID=1419009 RepID=A0AAV4ZZ57_9AGAM|nr:hypothetical protein Clacol_001400 [Clathrus columnatus]
MHLLETILQLNVATDQAAVTHLPFVVSVLTAETFKISSCIPKWVARINSLFTSKHTGARWAGLCLALQTGILNKDILKECSQNWISICLPLLSRNEDIPNLKASIRLLNYIFFVTHDISEFQRQLATPNVPKYSTALLNLAERTEVLELQKLCLESLARLIPLYPTLHRQLQSNLSTFCSGLLSGKPVGSDPTMVERTCNVLSVLHLTSGKVASSTSWRKTLDTSIVNAWFAFGCLRTTFPRLESHQNHTTQPTFKHPPTDPLLAIPLSLDRLKSVICLVIHLLKAPVYRPTTVCIGELVDLALALLRSSSRTEEFPSDAQRHSLELSVIPDIWSVGCDLLSQMAVSPKFISDIVMCYSQPGTTFKQIAVLLPRKSVTSSHIEEALVTSSKRGKKRARGLDGDEVFQVGATVVCTNHDDEEVILVSLNERILTNVLFELSHSPASSFSHNPDFHGSVYNKILFTSRRRLSSGTVGWLNSGMGLIISSLDKSNMAERDDEVLRSISETRQNLNMLLHPRLPPLLRSNLSVEATSLFQSEHGLNDKANCNVIGIGTAEEFHLTVTTDVASASQNDQRQPLVLPSQFDLSQPAPQHVDPLIQSVMSLPNPLRQSDSILPVGNGQSPDKTANLEVTKLRVPPQPEQQTADTIFAQAQNTQGTTDLIFKSSLKSGIPALPNSPKLQRRSAQEMREVEPLNSDLDDEGIPEINLESDSD